MNSTAIDLGAIEAAQKRIATLVVKTPLVASPGLTRRSDKSVFLKLEHQQITRSFKLRGAANAISNLSNAQRERGVIGVSTGNHGRGLAHAAHHFGIRCVICMSRLVPQNKIERIEEEGAQIRIVGDSQDDAQVEVDRLVNEEDMTMLPPFDHFDIIAGQGTLGLEIKSQLPEVKTILVPLSGGGLISGVAIALKSTVPDVRVIGISMRRGAAMYESQMAGRPVAVEELPTLADALGGGIGLDNQHTYNLVRDWVDELVLVDEREIAEAIRYAYWTEGLVVEGSGAVGIAALLSHKVQISSPTVVVLSGANIDMNLHHRIIGGEDVDATGS